MICWYVLSRSSATSTKASGRAALIWAGRSRRSTSSWTDLNASPSALISALTSVTFLGTTPTSTTCWSLKVGWPEPSRICPRGASVVFTASLSPSVTCGAKTAGSQIGFHLPSARLSRSVVRYCQLTPAATGQDTSTGTVASFLVTFAVPALSVGLWSARSPLSVLILVATSVPVSAAPSAEISGRSALNWPVRQPSRKAPTAESGDGWCEQAASPANSSGVASSAVTRRRSTGMTSILSHRDHAPLTLPYRPVRCAPCRAGYSGLGIRTVTVGMNRSPLRPPKLSGRRTPQRGGGEERCTHEAACGDRSRRVRRARRG